MLNDFLSLLCIVIASVILTSMNYGAMTWQWWAIMLCMIAYRWLGMINN